MLQLKKNYFYFVFLNNIHYLRIKSIVTVFMVDVADLWLQKIENAIYTVKLAYKRYVKV